MYKIVIADDERLIRLTLKNLLDYSSLDCEVVATCKDGLEAYRVVKEIHADIVITDLVMPEMDGIELIMKVKEFDPNIQIIVLSNYSDFEYVRDAMKAGASDYLLKVGLDKKDLKKMIEQAKIHCQKSQEETRVKDQGIQLLQQCMVLTKNEHIINEDQFMKALSYSEFEEYKNQYVLAYFRVDHVHEIYEEKYENHAYLQNNLRDMVEESISNYIKHILIFISNHSGVILFQCKEIRRVLSICQSIIRNTQQYLQVGVSICVSDGQSDLSNFQKVYSSLLELHRSCFYKGSQVLIQSGEKEVFSSLQTSDIHYHLDFLNAYRSLDLDLMHHVLDDMLNYMQMKKIQSNQVIDYVVFILNYLEGKESELLVNNIISFENYITYIKRCETIDALREILHTLCLQLFNNQKQNYQQKYHSDIQKIMDYIMNNYDKRLTLHVISEQFQIKEQAISRMFKNETGMNINYFINDVKMRKAMEMLGNPTYKIKDIANAIGMEDALYFNKVFKKYYSISPSDYRKKLYQQKGIK